MKLSAKRPWTASLFILTSGLFAWIGCSWQLAVDQTRPRPGVIGPPPPDLIRVTEPVAFTTAKGVTLKGWYLAPGDAHAVVVLLHGHGYDRYAMLNRARWFMRNGYAALVYDARGHGESDAVRVTVGYREREDLLAAVGWLQTRGWKEYYALGFSQGAVAILGAAPELPGLRGAILESPFDTLAHHATRSFKHRIPWLPGTWSGLWYRPLLRQRMGLDASTPEPIKCVQHLSCPSLFIAGGEDPYSPPEDVRLLFDKAPEPKRWRIFEETGHGDFFASDPEGYTREVQDFLNFCEQPDHTRRR